MNKEIKVKVGELQENDLIIANGVRFFAIDLKDERVLFQSEDGLSKLIYELDKEVSQLIDAPRGFEPVIESKRENCLYYQLPERKTKKSAGYDFFSPVAVEILPGEVVTIWTNVKAFMEDDEELRLSIRSGLSLKGLRMTNGLGIVDSDYYSCEQNDGNIGFMMHNVSNDMIRISVGDRIGQGVFAKYLTTYDDKANGVRKGGIGSTGR